MSDETSASDSPPGALALLERGGALNRQQRRTIEAALRRAKKRNKQLGFPRTLSAIITTSAFVGTFLTANWWLLIPAFFFTLVTAGLAAAGTVEALATDPDVQSMLAGWQQAQQPLPSTARGHIGMGATIYEGAVVEPGATVEMGATVGKGAIIASGAVVGMGSTIETDAIVESGASIGWGATVRSGAVVRQGAKVGAGSTVESGAEVPLGMVIMPGSTVAKGSQTGLAPSRAAASLPSAKLSTVDPRDTRIDELCDRFENELEHVGGRVEEFLRNPTETVTSVRRTCHDLLQRERALRREANPEEQERLNREAAALETRIADEPDEVTRKRLQGAVAAIEEQRRQRLLLLRDANRLEAEQTRLVWTMEGLVAHMVRLRSTQGETARLDLDRGLSTLRDEVASIASALEQVQSVDHSEGVASVGEEMSDARLPARERVR